MGCRRPRLAGAGLALAALVACGKDATHTVASPAPDPVATTSTITIQTPRPVETVALTGYQQAKKDAGFPESSYKGMEAKHHEQVVFSDGKIADFWSDIENVNVDPRDLKIELEIVDEAPERIGTVTVPRADGTSFDLQLKRGLAKRNIFVVQDGTEVPNFMYGIGYAKGANFGGTIDVGGTTVSVINAYTTNPSDAIPPTSRLSSILAIEAFQGLGGWPDRATRETVANELGREAYRPGSAVSLYRSTNGQVTLGTTSFPLLPPNDARTALFRRLIAEKSGDPNKTSLDAVINVS